MSRAYPSANRWWQHSESYWLCLYWDVYREGDHWRAAFIYGKRAEPQEFRTATAAMSYVDSRRD